MSTRISLILLAVLLPALLPSACGAEPENGDFFSTPDTFTPPTFSGRNRPATFTNPLFGPAGDPPTREAVRSIPSITPKQLQQLDQLINRNRDATTPLQDEVTSLRKILQNRKLAQNPSALQQAGTNFQNGGMMMAGEAPALDVSLASYEPDEAIQARIAALNQQITNIRNGLWPGINALLSPDQLNQLQMMRNGQLLISSNAPTDVPPPPPPSKPAAAAPAKPAPGPAGMPPFAYGAPSPTFVPPQAHASAAPILRSLAQPALMTTRQLLYRTLWRP